CDQNGCHGFLRARDGTYATFDPPGSVFTAAGWGGGAGINPAGTTAGYYYDASSHQHGFVRDCDGTFAEFDIQGSGFGVTGINPAGVITGGYCDASGFFCPGFLRATDGTITTFYPAGAQTTGPLGINPAGAIAGYYQKFNDFVTHGFVR